MQDLFLVCAVCAEMITLHLAACLQNESVHRMTSTEPVALMQVNYLNPISCKYDLVEN